MQRLIPTILITGALFGLLGVITGALGAHALEERLTTDQLDSYETAVRFQMYHALALLGLGVMAKVFGTDQGLWWVWLSWLLGTLLFSGSIYLLVLTPIKVGIVTPIGGIFLILGWGMLAVWAARQARTS